jgi:hypothetical protein
VITDDGMRHIRLFQVCDLFLGQSNGQSADACSRCVIFVAPMIGAVTCFFCNSQAARYERAGPHAFPISATRSTTSAHRLDEYLQTTTFSVEKDRVQAQIRLTPGVTVLPLVLAKIIPMRTEFHLRSRATGLRGAGAWRSVAHD